MMKANVLAKGYVSPYDAMCCFAIPLIFSSLFVCSAVFFASYTEIAVVSISLALLCCLLPVIGLAFDKSAMRYRITDAYVQSSNLFCTCCRLQDSQVKQIELQWSWEFWKDFMSPNAIHLVCSDNYYAQVKYIARKYHRKNQVVIRVTRKNFAAVKIYLARMGIQFEFSDYDMMLQLLQQRQLTYRTQGGAWTLQ